MNTSNIRPVARAAAEFTVIVVGVLTALAVDEWREAADDAVLRDEYLDGLVVDITDEVSYLEYVAELSRQRMAAADRILLFLGRATGESDPSRSYSPPTAFVRDSVSVDLSEASKMQFFVPEAVVWEDLMATGNLRLIEDAEVRRRVSRYYTQIRYQTRDLSQLQARFTNLSMYLLDHGIPVSSRDAVSDRVSALRSLPQLSAYVRSARDAQAEVLARTLDLKGYAEAALESVIR